MDLAELGVSVDTEGVVGADEALDSFAESAGKAEDAAIKFRREAQEAGSATTKMRSEVDSVTEGFNLLALGAAAAWAAISTGIAMGISGAIGRIEEADKSLRQFEQALQNTGNAANTSADEFDAFANRLQSATGRAAQEVRDIGSNLATFGFDNEIFYKSIELANDMSAAWGGDLRSSMEGLGRALDDPIAGFAMLSKRGISLTDEQAAMVKQLVETNKKLEAQRYIIEILNDQVGGVAEAGFTGFAAAQQRLTNAIEGFFEALVQNTGLIDLMVTGMNAAAAAIGFVSDNLDTLLMILTPVGVAIGLVFGPTLLASITAITAAIAGPLMSAIGAMTVALMANPFGLLVVGITAAVAAIWRFREQLGLTDERLAAIGEVASRVFRIIVTSVEAMYNAVAPWIIAIYDKVVEWGTYVVETLSPAWTAFKETVIPVLEEIWGWVDKILTAMEDMLGITSKVQSVTKNSSANDNSSRKMREEIEKGGQKAAEEMGKSIEKGGSSAAQQLSKSSDDGAKRYKTALEAANQNSASAMKKGVEEGGDTAAAAITAAGNIMAAKFEGTGRNIYDLWNNWGDAFIGSFGRTIGDLLVSFQRAQTDLLKAQADLAKAQADQIRYEMSDSYRNLQRSLNRDSSSSSSSSSGGSGSVIDWSPPEDRVLEKYSVGDRVPTELSRETITLNGRETPKDERNAGVVVVNKIVNQFDPNDFLNVMNSKSGRDTVKNIISQNPDVLRSLVG